MELSLILDVLKIRVLGVKFTCIFVLKTIGRFYEGTAICDDFKICGSFCEKAVLY